MKLLILKGKLFWKWIHSRCWTCLSSFRNHDWDWIWKFLNLNTEDFHVIQMFINLNGTILKELEQVYGILLWIWTKKKKKNKKIWMPRFLNLMLLFETGCNIKWEYMWICMLNLLNEYIMTHFHTVASKDYLHTAAILRIPSKLFINTMPSFMNCTILHLELVMLFHSLKF